MRATGNLHVAPRAHLARHLERFFSVTASAQVIERGARELGRSHRIHVVLDDAGTVWYRIRSR